MPSLQYCVGAISSEAFSQLQRSRACVINSETLHRDLKKRIRKSQYIATTDIESSSNIAAAWLMRRDFSYNDIRAIEAHPSNSNPTLEDISSDHLFA